ncbi:hypothetical protein WA158_007714 [Blastocystis sp. Blastoise]
MEYTYAPSTPTGNDSVYSYTPIADEDIEQEQLSIPRCDFDVVEQTYKDQTGKYLIVYLHYDQKITFVGGGYVSVKKGMCSCLGYKMKASDDYYPVISPAWESAIEIHSEKYNNKKTVASDDNNSIKNIYVPNADLWEVVVVFKSSSTESNEGLNDYSIPGLSLIPNTDSDYGNIFIPKNVGKICHRNSIQEDLWTNCFETLFKSPFSVVPSFLTCGPRGSGKSTLSRVLVNKLLNTYKQVAYLDIDLGQPEFTIEGYISFSLLSTPLLQPSLSSIYIGDHNPENCPTLYMKAVYTLYQTYIQYFSDIPVVINTSGWVKGMGYDILLDIYTHFNPIYTLCIQSPNSYDAYTLPEPPNGAMLLTIPAVKNGFIQTSVQKRDYRLFSSLEYNKLNSLLSSDPISLSSSLYKSIYIIPTYSIQYTSIALYCGQISPELFHIPINGCLVGLSIYTQPFTTNDKTPCLLSSIPICESVGFGIVRAINLQNKSLYIMTTVSPDLLKQVNLLIKGCRTLPYECVYKDCLRSTPYFSSRGNGVGSGPIKSLAGACSTGDYEVIIERQYAAHSGEKVIISSAESSFLRSTNVFHDESVATQDSKVEYKVCLDGNSDYSLELSSKGSIAWAEGSFVSLSCNKVILVNSRLNTDDKGIKTIKFNLSSLLASDTNWKYSTSVDTASWKESKIEEWGEDYIKKEIKNAGITTYFRKDIIVDGAFSALQLTVRSQSGFLVFVNGIQVYTYLLPESSDIDQNTPSQSVESLPTYKQVLIPKELFGSSTSLSTLHIAIELHTTKSHPEFLSSFDALTYITHSTDILSSLANYPSKSVSSTVMKSNRIETSKAHIRINRITKQNASNEKVLIKSENGILLGTLTQGDNIDETYDYYGDLGIWSFELSSNTHGLLWSKGSLMTVSVVDDNSNTSVVITNMRTSFKSIETYYVNTDYSLLMKSTWKYNTYNSIPTKWYGSSIDDSTWSSIDSTTIITPSLSNKYYVFRKTIDTPSIDNQIGFILNYKTLSNSKIYINEHEIASIGFLDGYEQSKDISTIVEQTATGSISVFDNQSTITISVIIFDSQHSINISFDASLLMIVDKHDDILRNKDKFEYNDEISKNRKLFDEQSNRKFVDSSAMSIVYSYDNITPPKHWTTNLFNDNVWSTASSSSSLPDVPSDSITQYYRIHYTTDSLSSSITYLNVTVSTYAGMIIYINGVEIRRINMDDGDNIQYNTLATAGYTEYKSIRTLVSLVYNKEITSNQESVIAIEIHRFNTIYQPNNNMLVRVYGISIYGEMDSIQSSLTVNGDEDPSYPLSNAIDHDFDNYAVINRKCQGTIFTYQYMNDLASYNNFFTISYPDGVSSSFIPTSYILEGSNNNGVTWTEIKSVSTSNSYGDLFYLDDAKGYNMYRIRIINCGSDSSLGINQNSKVSVQELFLTYNTDAFCYIDGWSVSNREQYLYKACPKGQISDAKATCNFDQLDTIVGDVTCRNKNPSEIFFKESNIVIIQNRAYEQFFSVDSLNANINISPSLPQGLTLDTVSQKIYGTPSNISPATTYTLSYTDENSNTKTYDISITVKRPYCDVDGEWESQQSNSNAFLSCPTGYSGSISRYCNSDCLWEEPNMVNCIFNGTPCTGTDYYNGSQCVECENGITSSLNGNNYICTPCEEGTYVYKNKCYSYPYCHPDGDWPQTNPDTIAKKSCPFLYKGDITRYCNDNMIWEEEDNSNCVELPPCTGTTYLSGTECIECDGIVTVENGKNIACTPCQEGTYAYKNKCYDHLYCEADGDWPQTNPDTIAKKSCPFLYKGDITRYCNDNMIWEEENSNSCIKLPPCTGNTYLSGTQCVECLGGEIITENGYNIACTPCKDDEHMYNGKCLSDNIVCPTKSNGFVTFPETKVGRKAAIKCSNDDQFGYYYVLCDYISGVPTWSNEFNKENCYPRPSTESGKGLQLVDYTFNLNTCPGDITDLLIPYARTFIHTYPYELTDLKMATNYDENTCNAFPLQVYYGTNTEIYESATYKQKLYIKNLASSTSNIQESSSTVDDKKCYLNDHESGCQHLEEGYQMIPTNSYHSDTYFCKQHQLKYTSMPVRSFETSNTNIFILGITIDKVENHWIDPENIAAVYKSIIASIDLPLKQLQLIDTTSNTLSKLLGFSFYISFPEQLEVDLKYFKLHLNNIVLKQKMGTILEFEQSTIITQVLNYDVIE